MTAPGGATGLIQTIMTIRNLQQQDEARELAKQQFGLQQEQFGLQKDQLGLQRGQFELSKASTKEQMLGHLATLASSLPDPKVLLPHTAAFASSTELPEEVLQTIFSNASPTEAATKGKVLKQGVDKAGDAIAAPAAYANFIGKQPGELGLDAFQAQAYKGASDYLQGLPAEEKTAFNQGVAYRVAQGVQPGDAVMDQIFVHMPKDQQTAAVEIGKRLAPSAGEIIQGRLGVGALNIQSNQASSEAAWHTAQVNAAMAEAQARLTGKTRDDVQAIIKQIDERLKYMTTDASRFNELSRARNNATLNALYEQVKALDPKIGALFVPIPPNQLDQDFANTGLGDFLKNRAKKP